MDDLTTEDLKAIHSSLTLSIYEVVNDDYDLTALAKIEAELIKRGESKREN